MTTKKIKVLREYSTHLRILKSIFNYKNIAIGTAWFLTAYGSMYIWMEIMILIFK